jgi:hypothetical protein
MYCGRKTKKTLKFFLLMPEISSRKNIPFLAIFFQRILATAVVNFELCHIAFLGGLYMRYKHYPFQVGL